ncbi:MAG: hypothetical protein P8I13_04035 [Porticoccaceae bacterium]|nr:hypothetical protein [Porticoccaceae bacterium]
MTNLNIRRQKTEIKYISPIEHNSFFQSIGDVLSNHWDPLGIFDSHWPHDKYDRYIPVVYTRALNSNCTKDLIQYLTYLASDVLGVKTNMQNDKRAAELILAVRDYYFRNVNQ